MTTKGQTRITEQQKRKEKCSSSGSDLSDKDQASRENLLEKGTTSPPRKTARNYSPDWGTKRKMADKMEIDAATFAQILATPAVGAALKSVIAPILEEKLTAMDERITSITVDQDKMKKMVEEKELRLQTVELKLENMEQQTKQKRLKIVGLKEEENENTAKKVLEFINKIMKVETEAGMLTNAYRIGKKEEGKHRPIIIEFTTIEQKHKVYRARIHLSKCKEGEKIFINEDLTLVRNKLYFEARKLQKSGHITSCWTMGGSIFVRLPQGTSRQIRTETDLTTLNLTWAERVDSAANAGPQNK